MKKTFALRIISLAMVIIMLPFVFCACNASNSKAESAVGDMYSNESAGSVVTSPEKNSNSTVESERKIIKTVTMSAETKEFDKTVENIEKMCSEIGGYIESSTVNGNSLNDKRGSRSATYTLRIPANKLDDFTGDIENGVNVTSLTSNIDEITDAYYDAVARLSVLESQKESLQKMYDSFTSYSDINDMMVVQDKLYDVIEEIESYKARINAYDNKVEYSTVNLNLFEVVEYTEPEVEEKGFGQRLGEAFVSGWTDFWQGCQDFAVWFVEAFPTLMVWAAIIVVLCIISRKWRKNRKEKKAAKTANSDKNNESNNGENKSSENNSDTNN